MITIYQHPQCNMKAEWRNKSILLGVFRIVLKRFEEIKGKLGDRICYRRCNADRFLNCLGVAFTLRNTFFGTAKKKKIKILL